jgi:hypothetical protein
MKCAVELWVRLKVIDLVTQTAHITLTEKLDFGWMLRGMKHYWYWAMEAEGRTAPAILDEIDRVVRFDSAFTNQNKHVYCLAGGEEPARGDLALEKDLPAESAGGKTHIVDVLVRERRSGRDADYAARLNGRLRAVRVSDLKYGEVWRLVVGIPEKSSALAEVDRMLVSRSRRDGLLLNPHYQRYEILGAREL